MKWIFANFLRPLLLPFACALSVAPLYAQTEALFQTSAISGPATLPISPLLEESANKSIIDPMPGDRNSDRPTELPPLLTPPGSSLDRNGIRSKPRKNCNTCDSDYDPSYLYLPEYNPMSPVVPVAAPCPCQPFGRFWFDGAYFLATTREDIVDHDFRSGFRFNSGLWLDKCQNRGIEAGFFYLEGGKEVQAGNAQGMPGTFLGGEIHFRKTLLCQTNRRLDFLAGYRYAHLSEQLNITTPAGFTHYETRNHLHVKQVGLAGEYRMGSWFLEGIAKVGIGLTKTNVEINNVTTTHHDFVVVPEVNVNMGRQLFEHWRMFAGYSFLYASSVGRPGEVALQGRQASTGFWMQGINIGLQARY